MTRLYTTLFIVLCSMSVLGQVPDTTKLPAATGLPPTEVPASTTEQQLESITEASESNDESATEDDSYLQLLKQFQSDPVNLNTVDESVLKDLLILTPIQIQSLITYRNTFGKLINLYELQAVPGWDIGTIQKLRPFITVRPAVNFARSFGGRFRGGTHSILLRGTQVVEEAEGYKVLDRNDPTKYLYPGSQQRIFLRYKYVYKNLLQYGVVGEKDAGEQFFKGAQKQGFDFYSAHLFARNIGIIKALAIGDYLVNLGQGLTQWQSLAFKKGADVLNIKRQAAVLKPYNSSGEINFHRGLGITIGRKNWEATIFGSYRKLDGTFNEGDTAIADDEFISADRTTGYHRTALDLRYRNVQARTAVGGNVSYNTGGLHIGINGIQQDFKVPIIKAKTPNYLYFDSAKNFGNYSIDYSYSFKNMHFFGEAAITDKSYKAFVNGLLISLDAKVDMSLLYRDISAGYRTFNANAFTENYLPINERGLYAGISIKPNSNWRIDAYADFNKTPWLNSSYQMVNGTDYLVQATYKPNKRLEMYARYRMESETSGRPAPLKDFRAQFSYRVSSPVTLRSRVEFARYDKNVGDGFLNYFDIIYKPVMRKLSGNLRLQYFESNGLSIYVYENDVLYSYSIPQFNGKGYRYYLNLNYDVSKRLSLWFRWAQTIYNDRDVISKGTDDEIQGNTKSEVKLQALYQFR